MMFHRADAMAENALLLGPVRSNTPLDGTHIQSLLSLLGWLDVYIKKKRGSPSNNRLHAMYGFENITSKGEIGMLTFITIVINMIATCLD